MQIGQVTHPDPCRTEQGEGRMEERGGGEKEKGGGREEGEGWICSMCYHIFRMSFGRPCIYAYIYIYIYL